MQPIKSFHLIIDGQSSIYGNKEPTMCFEKQIKKTGPFRYEVTVLNFKPQKDIAVFFF